MLKHAEKLFIDLVFLTLFVVLAGSQSYVGLGVGMVCAAGTYILWLFFGKQPVFYAFFITCISILAVVFSLQNLYINFALFCTIWIFSPHFLYKRVEIRLGMMLAISGMLLWYHVEEFIESKLLLGGVIVLILMMLHFLQHKEFKESIFPIFLLIGLCVFVSPARDEPYGWEWAKNMAAHVEQSFYRVTDSLGLQRKRKYHITTSGFGEGGYLFSSLNQSNLEQLKVKGEPVKSGLYLVGNISDTYAFDHWEKHAKNPTENPTACLEAFVFLKNLYNSQIEWDTWKDFIKIYTYEISHEDIRSEGTFGGMFTLKQEQLEQSYKITVMEVSYASNEMNLFLTMNRDNSTLTKTQFEAICDIIKDIFGFSFTEMITYQDVVRYEKQWEDKQRQNYVALPKNLNKRLYTLSDEIVKDCSSDFEKCKEMEKYLSKFGYSSQVDFKKKECAVSEFLLDTQTGYCVHFASALAVLLRCQNIPTRYVEGYFVDFMNQVGLKTYGVKGTSSHAWVEAYIDHVGWIRLEPTPIYKDIANTSWIYNNEIATGEMEELAQQSREKASWMELSLEENVEYMKTGGMLLLLLLFAGLIMMVLVLGYIHLLQKRKWKKATGDLLFRMQWNLMNFYFTQWEGPAGEGETLTEYLRRQSWMEETDKQKVLELSYGIWYGEKTLTGEDQIYMIELLDKLRRKYLYSEGKKAGLRKWILWIKGI